MNKEDDKNKLYSLDNMKFVTLVDELKNKLNSYEMISSSMKNKISSDDTNYYIPQNLIVFPTVFPSSPNTLKAEFFEKFDINTLMFIFFYQNDPFAKYNAGKELSKREWIYSKKYCTWFILISPPKTQNEDIIEGKFKFWDFEKEWTSGVKKDFKFELKYLEKFE